MTDEQFDHILEMIKTPEARAKLVSEMLKPLRQRYDKFYKEAPRKRVYIGYK